MKERPILFSGAMVRAILDGRKTQTRRVLKQAVGPSLSVGIEDEPGVAELSWLSGPGPGYDVEETIKRVACPYGQPGDRLWVRETWKPSIVHSCFDMACDCETVWVDYPAGGEGNHFYGDDIPDEWYMPQAAIKGRHVPSLHMPRWASRLVVEITDVRVERLNDCSEADAIAEGVEPVEQEDIERTEPDHSICRWCGGNRLYTAFSGQGGALPDTDCLHCDTHLKRYEQLWDHINGAGAWEANPWVWVVELKRI